LRLSGQSDGRPKTISPVAPDAMILHFGAIKATLLLGSVT
jgi:hypothetical protein